MIKLLNLTGGSLTVLTKKCYLLQCNLIMKVTNIKKGIFSFYSHNMNKKINESHFNCSGLKVGDKSLINSQISLHEAPAKLNFEGETNEVMLSSQAHFVICLG